MEENIEAFDVVCGRQINAIDALYNARSIHRHPRNHRGNDKACYLFIIFPVRNVRAVMSAPLQRNSNVSIARNGWLFQ